MFKSIVSLWKNGYFSTLFILRMMLCDVLIFIRVKKTYFNVFFIYFESLQRLFIVVHLFLYYF